MSLDTEAPLIDVGADTHKEIDRVEQSEGVSRWKSAFKRLPSTLHIEKKTSLGMS